MNYWKIIYYTGEGDYETSEVLINNDEYEKIQDALSKGADMLILSGRPTIKRSSLKAINGADDIIADYKRVGIPLKELGLTEPLKIAGEKPAQIYSGMGKIGAGDIKKFQHP